MRCQAGLSFGARLLAVVLLATVAGADIKVRVGGKRVDAGAKVRADEVRVLFIGNSLTYFNEMPWLAEEVAKSLSVKPRLRADFSGRSGATLRQQWERGRAVRAIREGKYHYVVLQPQSTEILRPEEQTLRYAKMLDEEIRQSGAKTILFLTWAPLTAKHEQSAYNREFAKLSKELGARIAPVGVAWESLRKQGIELFDQSGLHANLAGSYLSACVFVATIYDRSPAKAVYTFDVHFDEDQFYRRSLEHEHLDGVTAATIQREAWRAVSAAGKVYR
jgi:hypothetical protein